MKGLFTKSKKLLAIMMAVMMILGATSALAASGNIEYSDKIAGWLWEKHDFSATEYSPSAKLKDFDLVIFKQATNTLVWYNPSAISEADAKAMAEAYANNTKGDSGFSALDITLTGTEQFIGANGPWGGTYYVSGGKAYVSDEAKISHVVFMKKVTEDEPEPDPISITINKEITLDGDAPASEVAFETSVTFAVKAGNTAVDLTGKLDVENSVGAQINADGNLVLTLNVANGWKPSAKLINLEDKAYDVSEIGYAEVLEVGDAQYAFSICSPSKRGKVFNFTNAYKKLILTSDDAMLTVHKSFAGIDEALLEDLIGNLAVTVNVYAAPKAEGATPEKSMVLNAGNGWSGSVVLDPGGYILEEIVNGEISDHTFVNVLFGIGAADQDVDLFDVTLANGEAVAVEILNVYEENGGGGGLTEFEITRQIPLGGLEEEIPLGPPITGGEVTALGWAFIILALAAALGIVAIRKQRA